MVRLCVCVCVCVCVSIQGAHTGAWGVSHLSPHTLPRSAALPFLHTHTHTNTQGAEEDKLNPRPFPLTYGSCKLIWNQHLATASQTRLVSHFFLSLGRKEVTQHSGCRSPLNTLLPHQGPDMYSSLAEVSQPPSPLLSQHPHLSEQMAELNNCLFWAPWREYGCPLISMEESNQRTY